MNVSQKFLSSKYICVHVNSAVIQWIFLFTSRKNIKMTVSTVVLILSQQSHTDYFWTEYTASKVNGLSSLILLLYDVSLSNLSELFLNLSTWSYTGQRKYCFGKSKYGSRKNQMKFWEIFFSGLCKFQAGCRCSPTYILRWWYHDRKNKWKRNHVLSSYRQGLIQTVDSHKIGESDSCWNCPLKI